MMPAPKIEVADTGNASSGAIEAVINQLQSLRIKRIDQLTALQDLEQRVFGNTPPPMQNPPDGDTPADKFEWIDLLLASIRDLDVMIDGSITAMNRL